MADGPVPSPGRLPEPGFQLAVADRPHGTSYSLVAGRTALPAECVLERREPLPDGGVRLSYRHPDTGLAIGILWERTPGTVVFRQSVQVRNDGSRDVTLTHVSSLFLPGIGTGDAAGPASAESLRPWSHPGRFRLHYCLQCGQGENQWREAGLEDLGLMPTCVHGTPGAIQFVSVGSRSTGRHVPMLVLEDRDAGESWFLQFETSGSWFLEIGNLGPGLSDRGALFLHASAAAERQLGFCRTLAPGESFRTPPCAAGRCPGGFEEAVRELDRHRRRISARLPDGRPFPIVFNDFMNCLWAEPTLSSLLPLLSRAADAGCDVFCMDAGWFHPAGADLNDHLGDWVPAESRYTPLGFRGLLDRIREAGLVPGLWLELEVCGFRSRIARTLPEAAFLHRNGVRIRDNPRQFLDLAHPEVRSHLLETVDRLVGMGIGYIKNDFNGCVSLGDNNRPGRSPAAGLLEQTDALQDLVRDIRARHPGLVLENCASGAMRQDYGLLSGFHVQSVSDQEREDLFPAILQGAMACLLPEHCGAWAYPRPRYFPERNLDPETDPAAVTYGGPEQTVLTLVNGLCGRMMLSGRIDRASGEDLDLIREAVSLSRSLGGFLESSFPAWPLGMARIGDRTSFPCLALWNEDRTDLLLFAWRRDGDEAVLRVPLPRAILSGGLLFPSSRPQGRGFEPWCREGRAGVDLRLDGRRTAAVWRFRTGRSGGSAEQEGFRVL